MERLSLPIVGRGMRIDALVPADAPALSRSHSDSTNARFQGWTSPLSLADAGAFIDAQRGGWPVQPGGGVQLAIRTEQGGELVGDLYIARPDDDPSTLQLGITLVPGCHGRGLATSAVRAVLDAAHGLDGRPGAGIDRIEVFVDEDNVASRRLFERCGFVLAERLVGASDRRDGSLADGLVYRCTPPSIPREGG